jgi:hypothetical protein
MTVPGGSTIRATMVRHLAWVLLLAVCDHDIVIGDMTIASHFLFHYVWSRCLARVICPTTLIFYFEDPTNLKLYMNHVPSRVDQSPNSVQGPQTTDLDSEAQIVLQGTCGSLRGCYKAFLTAAGQAVDTTQSIMRASLA